MFTYTHYKPYRDVTPLHFTLEYLIDRDYKIFWDTCSLVDRGAVPFWRQMESYLPAFLSPSRRMAIPYLVCCEMSRIAMAPVGRYGKDPELAERARVALGRVRYLTEGGYAAIHKGGDEVLADNTFQSVFMRYRTRSNLLLVTQDHNLAVDIRRIDLSRRGGNTSGFRVDVMRLDPDGSLLPHIFNNFTSNQRRFNYDC